MGPMAECSSVPNCPTAQSSRARELSPSNNVKRSLWLCVFVVFLVLKTPPCAAQEPTLFNHSDDSRVWVAGQINLIHQQHPSFFAKYTGENSLNPRREKATSRLLTLYTGFQISKSTPKS